MQNVIAGLDNLSNSEFYKQRKPNRQDYMKAAYTEQWEDEETMKSECYIKDLSSILYHS